MKKLIPLFILIFIPAFFLSAQVALKDQLVVNDSKISNNNLDLLKPAELSFSTRKTPVSDHLIVIDGKICDIDLAMVKATDIESISVSNSPKDKEAYGILAENGVIYIRTKKNIAYNSEVDQQFKPLILVDGRVYTDCIDFIKPQEIESMTVLKDYSATKSYGKAGENGVILIKRKVLTDKY